MKLYLQIFLIFSLFIFAGCATSTSKQEVVDENLALLFEDVLIDQSDLIFYVEEFKKSAGKYTHDVAAKVTKDFIEEHSYNKLLEGLAKKDPEYSDTIKLYHEISQAAALQKYNLLKSIENDRSESVAYKEEFHQLKDAGQRLDLVGSILDNDFPSNFGTDFFAKMSLSMIRPPSLFSQKKMYYSMRSNFMAASLHIKLFNLKDISTSLLAKVNGLQNDPRYKKVREFVEKIQSRANDIYLEKLFKAQFDKGLGELEFEKFLN